MNKRAKIIKFVSSNKKQIVFALFALLCIIDAKTGSGILKCAAPVVAVAAVEGAGTAAAAGGGTAAAAGAGGSAAAAGSGGAAAGASGTAAGASGTAGATGTAAGTSGTAGATGTVSGTVEVSGTAGTSGGSTVASSEATVQSASNPPKPTNTGGAGNNTTPTNNLNHNNDGLRKTNPDNSDSLTKNKPESAGEQKKEAKELNKEQKKEAKNEKERRRKRLPDRDNRDDEDEDDENYNQDSLNMDPAYDSLTRGKPLRKLGCFVILLLASILLLPTMFVSNASNTFTATTLLESIADDVSEAGDFFKRLAERFSNSLKYHYFATNKETFSNVINDVYEKVYNKYGVPIDVPLLLSTLLTNPDALIPEVDENNQLIISKETMRKLEYAEDLAKLQIDESEDIYLCSSKEVDGKMQYYTILYTDSVDESLVITGSCKESTVGKYIRKSSTKIDSEKYYEKLKDNVILTLLYPDYEESKDLIVSKIKSQYQAYEILYMKPDEDESGVPSDLLYDTEVAMQAPLKGKITITSPFGGRGDVYVDGRLVASGSHNGIDIYASDRSIYAAGNGTVYRTYFENTGGNIVEILHTTASGKRYISQYAHLSQILVSKDEEVKAGDLIAIMGCTGNACTGTHLHFGIKDLDTNEWYNPKPIVERTIN